MWRIQYCNCWSHFEKCTGRVYSITCELLIQLERVCVLCLFGLQPIKLQWVINICLLYVIVRYTWLGLLRDIVLLSTINKSFYYVSSQNSTYLRNFESISLWYFVSQYFNADKFIYDVLKSLITETKQTLKDGALSGFNPSLWVKPWLWFKLSGFSNS